MAFDLGDSITLAREHFTNGFADGNKDIPCTVVLLDPFPVNGSLYWSGKLVTASFEFGIDCVSNLTYKRTTSIEYTDIIHFKITDNSQTKLSSKMARVTLNVAAHVNQPPSEVGDKAFTLTSKQEITFTVANFTTETTPPYADPEGDSALNLKVLTLPASGTLKFDGGAVTVNQVISMTDISAGKFKYASPLIDSATAAEFTFSLSDSGSGQYTS